MKNIYTLASLATLDLEITRPSLIFLYGDLGVGKTTLSQQLISNFTGTEKFKITSPTYVYYNKYQDVHHFDLYRLEDYDTFVSLGAEEIFDNNEGIILVEWPELIESYYKSDINIYISKTQRENEREVTVEYR